MSEIVKLKREHIEELAKEPENAFLKDWLTNGHAGEKLQEVDAVAGIVNENIVIIAGLTPYWKGRAHLWCVFSEKAKGNFVAVFRVIQRYLKSRSYPRIEMDVPLDTKFSNMAGKRAMLLGFKLECPRAKHYRPNGGDSALYSWVREAINE